MFVVPSGGLSGSNPTLWINKLVNTEIVILEKNHSNCSYIPIFEIDIKNVFIFVKSEWRRYGSYRNKLAVVGWTHAAAKPFHSLCIVCQILNLEIHTRNVIRNTRLESKHCFTRYLSSMRKYVFWRELIKLFLDWTRESLCSEFTLQVINEVGSFTFRVLTYYSWIILYQIFASNGFSTFTASMIVTVFLDGVYHA